MHAFPIDPSVPQPRKPRPIVVIGAGAIVREAHLPGYARAGWSVAGIYDPQQEKAARLANEFSIPLAAPSIEALIAAAPADAVFDIAVPAAAIAQILPLLPDGAVVQIQKPFGENLDEADRLLRICREKKLIAAVNFQHRFIPQVVAAKKIIDEGLLGTLHHFEVRIDLYTPWDLWTFLYGIPRMEILYHSIHYLDLMRHFFGDPKSIYAKTVKHPDMMQLASVRSNMILDYGDAIQAVISTNHVNRFGQKHLDGFLKWEGTKGAIRFQIGKNINFPEGVPDTFEVSRLEPGRPAEWEDVAVEGSYFPDAFRNGMANLLCFAEGSVPELINSVESGYRTMKLVEAAYRSNEKGGEPLDGSRGGEPQDPAKAANRRDDRP